MKCDEAVKIAEKLLNLNSKDVTLQEIYSALAVLSNFYVDFECLKGGNIEEKKV